MLFDYFISYLILKVTKIQKLKVHEYQKIFFKNLKFYKIFEIFEFFDKISKFQTIVFFRIFELS